jgi:thiol-disulfide isomerase/thioredoxin
MRSVVSLKPMSVRPRMMVISMVVAVVVSVPAGWGLWQITKQDPLRDGVANVEMSGPPERVVLSEPGEYQQPIDESLRLPGVLLNPVPLPVIELEDARSLPVSSGDLIGVPAVINIWFSTCPPCARELADFAEVHREVGDRIRFVGVNPFDSAEVMMRFSAERGVAYEQWRDPDSAFIDAVATMAFPRTLFVDASGMVVADTGVLTAAELRELIEALL